VSGQHFPVQWFLTRRKGFRVQLSFRIRAKTAAYLRETLRSKDRTIGQDGEWLKITATVCDSLFLKPWLLRFGRDVTDVRKVPVPIAAEVIKRAAID
jgi:hypothetical protein